MMVVMRKIQIKSGDDLMSQCREDYLNLVSIVRAHGLHESPRVSLAAFRCAHASPGLPCASSGKPT